MTLVPTILTVVSSPSLASPLVPKPAHSVPYSNPVDTPALPAVPPVTVIASSVLDEE